MELGLAGFQLLPPKFSYFSKQFLTHGIERMYEQDTRQRLQTDSVHDLKTACAYKFKVKRYVVMLYSIPSIEQLF